MSNERNEVLHALLQTWFDLTENGEEPDPKEICREHPELVPDFCRIVGHDVAAVAALDDVSGSRPAPAPHEPDESLGRVGEFEISSRLGSGATGDVFLARQPSLDRLVALKVLRRSETDERSRARFRREAEIAAGLEHPSIVPVFGLGESDGLLYIAMKWLSGPSLDKATTPMPPREVARIGASVARALHEAHEAGVIHRDVKPGNIMLDEGAPYVLDFGLARGADDIALTQTGSVAGTVLYMSPEQIRAGASTTILDARTDIYSLGATLYQLLCGRPPFEGLDAAKVIGRIVFTEPGRLRSVDVDLETIVLRAMEKDRDRRFDSAREMAEDLERYLRGEQIRSRPAGPFTRLFKLVRRHSRAAVVVGVLLLATLVLGGVLLAQHLREQGRIDGELLRVEDELKRGNLRVASGLLAGLRDRVAGEERYEELARVHEAAVLLEDLLDHLQDRSEAQDPFVTGELVEDIGELGGLRGLPGARRSFLLAKVARALVDGKPEVVLETLDEIAPGRDTAAFRLVASGAEAWTLPPPVGHGAIEHVFVVIAMKQAGRPSRDQRDEIEAAKQQHRGDYRLRYAELMWLAEFGSDPSAVLLGLEGARRGGAYRRSVLRNMLRSAVLMGRADKIAELLGEFERRFAAATWQAPDAAMVIQACSRLGEATRGKHLLERAANRWPQSFELAMVSARQAGIDGDPHAAREALVRARDQARYAGQREEADLQLLVLDTKSLASWENLGLVSITEADRGRANAQIARLRAFVTDAGSEYARAEASILAARLLLATARHSEADEMARSALALRPTPAARLELAAQAFAHYQSHARGDEERRHAMDDAFGALQPHAVEARRHLRVLLEAETTGGLVPRPDQLASAYHYEAALAFYDNDPRACIEAAELAIETCAESLPEPTRAYLARLKRLARRRL